MRKKGGKGGKKKAQDIPMTAMKTGRASDIEESTMAGSGLEKLVS